MKKMISLFLVLMMIFSTLCSVTVSADGTAVSITLSRNKTFIKTVDETASLIVIGLDENGEEAVLPEGTTFTYESTRPWVLSIADDGKFVDGGYDGTTKITVAASNGMEASAIFIKNSDNVYADISYVTAETTDKDDIFAWALSYVDQAVSSGLISGMTADAFAPQENATRAQVTSLIKRLLQA